MLAASQRQVLLKAVSVWCRGRVRGCTIVVDKVALHGADEGWYICDGAVLPVFWALAAVQVGAIEAVAHVLAADSFTLGSEGWGHQAVIVVSKMSAGGHLGLSVATACV